ncbi:hypothetical protein BLL52_0850 [Rhodoferax antarcticus ANT.BR]|uniref:Uncharacterized protein n=1 Tax=Rhodoferax antarcticus ANT.BR TaxID=1111071 RepID=A0A1Q8YI60_9BURK|nr:hypothetical protein BLL52_0850 [Rhodoferax antarcticus ANT.BR]
MGKRWVRSMTVSGSKQKRYVVGFGTDYLTFFCHINSDLNVKNAV